MTAYRFVMAGGMFADVEVEREHLAAQPAEVQMASLETPEDVARATADADGVIVTIHPLPRELIECFGPRMRIIGRAGIGLDAIDLEAARERGVAVFHCPDYATEEVATHTVALVLALNRKLVAGDALARRDFRAWQQLQPVRPLGEQTIGVVGLGRIGRTVAELLRPFAANLLGYDPYVTETPAGVHRVSSLLELLAGSDVVTLHLPLTAETADLIGASELGAMKSGAVLVNVSRGALVDETALAEGLRDGHIGAAGLDVLAQEPPAPDASILSAPNVLLSPHFAWYSEASERRARTMTVDGMLDYLAGRPLRAGRLAVEPVSRVISP